MLNKEILEVAIESFEAFDLVSNAEETMDWMKQLTSASGKKFSRLVNCNNYIQNPQNQENISALKEDISNNKTM